MVSMERRDFLKHFTTVVASPIVGLRSRTALMTLAGASASVNEPIPIVDAHQHLWDLDRFRLPWVSGTKALNRSFSTADYLEATRGLSIVRSVYLEVDVDPEQQVEEAEYAIGLCQDPETPTAGAVISGRPSSKDFRGYVERFAVAPEIKGLRQVLHGVSTPKGYCLTPEFVAGIQLLGEHGLSFDLCMRPEELNDAERLVAQCTGMAFILDHLGNARIGMTPLETDRWRTAISQLAERPNLVAKVSGIIASAQGKEWSINDLAPFVDHVIEAFGPDRVLFGGDWPVCNLGGTLKGWVEALKQIVASRPETDQRKLFSENADRVYRLVD